MKRNTLDLDYNDSERIMHVWQKVALCPDLSSLKVKRSPGLNGFHFEFWCRRQCELCRVVFDDPVRFMLDHHYRPTGCQNVLFSQKTFKKANQHIVLDNLFKDKYREIKESMSCGDNR